MTLTLQHTHVNPCCEANQEPIFVIHNGILGVTHFCPLCGYLILEETDAPKYPSGPKQDEFINVFEDVELMSPFMSILQKKVKYVVFPDGDSDDGLVQQLGVRELKLRHEV